MVVSLPFRRFLRQLTVILPQRHRRRRLRLRKNDFPIPAAIVETLECRMLLSSIVVNSTDGGQNYNSTVTASQLNPSQTAVTLRDAINAANNTTGNNTISFDSSVFPTNAQTPTTIMLSGGTPLELRNSSGTTTIAGPAAAQVAVSGNNLSTVFVVDAGVTAEIDGLTITGGKGSINLSGSFAGGGVFNSGTLTLQNDVITASSAGTYGGGLYNAGTGNVTVAGSTFSSDSAQLGGGFFNTGTVSVSGTTHRYSDDQHVLIRYRCGERRRLLQQ
jgi:hypothetical protein